MEVPNSQKARSTEASAPWKMALNLALYIAHDEPGDPGSGRSTEEDGDLVIVVPWSIEAVEVRLGTNWAELSCRRQSREHGGELLVA